MGNKNGKNKRKKEEVKEEEKEDNKFYSELSVTNKKIDSKYNNISELIIKTISIKEEIKYFDMFPNGNILIFNEEEINIYNSYNLKRIFNYKNDKISNILILSNKIILLLIPNEENNTFSIIALNITNSREIPVYTYNGNNSIIDYTNYNFVKLSSNRILLIYKLEYENDFDKDERNDKYHFVFFKYNEEKSNLEFDYYEEIDGIHYIDNIITCIEINSFIIFGNYFIAYFSNPFTEEHCIDLFRNKKFISLYKNSVYFNEEQKVFDCFFISKNYLIIVLESIILCYVIKEDNKEDNNENSENNVKVISHLDFSNKNYYDHLLKDKSHFYLIYKKNEDENNDEFIFIEFEFDFVDINIKIIKKKEENIKLKTCSKFLVHDNNLYCLSKDEKSKLKI